MKISTKGRYALRMMIDLAQNQGDGYVSLKDIANRQEISKKYLEQIVAILNKPDVLRTNRGYQGGYRLAKSANEYTVGDCLFCVTEQRIVSLYLFGKGCTRLFPNISTASLCRILSTEIRTFQILIT